MHVPVITSAQVRRRYTFREYRMVVLEEIVAVGQIEYEYLLVVFKGDATDPFFIVSSERNNVASKRKSPDADDDDFLDRVGIDRARRQRGSHFLCAFDEGRHYNMGDSDRWADAEQFEAAALQLLARRLGVPALAV